MDRETQRLVLLETVGSVMGAALVSRDLFSTESNAWMLFDGIRAKCEAALSQIKGERE